jgi:hypothetical protein
VVARVEEQPGRLVAGLFPPIVGEFRDHRVGLVAQQVGGRVADHPPAGHLGHERHDRGEGPVPHGHPVILQVGLDASERDRVEVEVEAQVRVSQRGLADQGGDQPLGHGAFGLVRVVGGEGGLGQDVETGEQPGAFVTAQVADMTDATFAEEFGDQQRQQRLQRRDLFGAGESRGGDGGGPVEFQEHGEEEEQTGDLGRESSPDLERQRADIGDVGNHRAIAGGLS